MKQQIDQPLRIGTDCSGIEAAIQSLRQLGVPHRHLFSSDIDKYCIKSINANYNPEILYGDMTKRDQSTLPDIDLYVCGFPCQPFSQAGHRKGFKDNRGNVFFSCIDVIRTKQPKYFILENVKGLLHHDKGNTWKVIWNEMEKLTELGYVVQWKVLNTRDYGIPQNRERVYMVGNLGKEFVWPKQTDMEPLENFVDYTDTKQHILSGKYTGLIESSQVPSESLFIDVSFACLPKRKFNNSHKFTGCLNTKGGLYCVAMKRYANSYELLKLQGFPIDFVQVVSLTQLRKQIGNTMSVNVVKKVLECLLF